MNNISLFLLKTLACLIILILNSCKDPVKVAIQTRDNVEGINALKKINEEDNLREVALRANNYNVAFAALSKITDQSALIKVAIDTMGYNHFCDYIVNNLTDQALLEKVALESGNFECRRNAINKLNNKNIIIKIALEDKDLEVRGCAIDNIKDPIILTKIALQDKEYNIRIQAINNLIDTAIFKKIATERGNKDVQFIYKYIRAFDNIPQDYIRNRYIYISEILATVRILKESEVVNKFGEILAIETSWKPLKQNYSIVRYNLTKGDLPVTGTITGELFNCKIWLKNLKRPLSSSWATYFPETTKSSYFKSADVYAGDLLLPLIKEFSHSILTEISMEVDFSKPIKSKLDSLLNKD